MSAGRGKIPSDTREAKGKGRRWRWSEIPLRFAEAPSASEEEEEPPEGQLEEKRQVEKEEMEALIRASKLPSPQTTNTEVRMG